MPPVWWQFRRAVESAEQLDVGRLVASGCVKPFSTSARAAYDAPFPDESFKAVLLAFSDGDPITAPMRPVLEQRLPGAAGREHPTIVGAGHFLQEDAGPALAEHVLAFVRST